MCLYTLARVELECGDFDAARQRLAEGARIALETQNIPNMAEVAIWAAQLAGREGAFTQAVESLSVVLEHPRTSSHERHTASEHLAAIATQLPAAELDRARQDARSGARNGDAARYRGFFRATRGKPRPRSCGRAVA